MKKTIKYLIIVVTLINSISCQQIEDVSNNDEIFNYYRKKPQKFIVNGTKGDTINGKEGTKIIIGVNAFVDKSGDVISDNIELEMTEYYTPQDIVLGNLSTSYSGQLLETGGMINLNANLNGEELKIKKGEKLIVEFSSEEMDGMETFYGNFELNKINWRPAVEKVIINGASFLPQEDEFYSVEAVVEEIATNSLLRNVLIIEELGWINCDRFINDSDLTNLRVNYDKGHKPSMFLIFKEIKSIMPSDYPIGYRAFRNLPIGYDVRLVAFSVKDSITYFASQDFIIQKQNEININFEEMSKEILEKVIIK